MPALHAAAFRDGIRVCGIDWAGTEGNDLSVLVSDLDRFTKAIEDYWYRAPE